MGFINISVRLDEADCAGHRVGDSAEIGGVRTEAYKGGERCGSQWLPSHSGEISLDGRETRMGGSCVGGDASLGVHPS